MLLSLPDIGSITHAFSALLSYIEEVALAPIYALLSYIEEAVILQEDPAEEKEVEEKDLTDDGVDVCAEGHDPNDLACM